MQEHVSRAARNGFTLIELVIVILLIAVLSGIAVAGYGAITEKAEDRAAESTLQVVDREFRANDAFDKMGDRGSVAVADMTTPEKLGVTFNADLVGDADRLDEGDTVTIETSEKVWTLTLGNATTVGEISSALGAGSGSGGTAVTVPVIDPVASAFKAGLSLDGTNLQPSLETPSLEVLGAGVTAFEVQCRVVENGEPHTSESFKIFNAAPSTVYDEPEDFVKYFWYIRVRSTWGYKTEGTGIACYPSNSGNIRQFMADVESGDRIEIEWQARTFNGVEWSNWSTTFSSGEVLIP